MKVLSPFRVMYRMMKKNRLMNCFGTALLALVVALAAGEAARGSEVIQIEDEILVRFKPGLGAGVADQILSQVQALEVRQIGRRLVPDLFFLKMPGNATAALNGLMQNPNVLYAHFNAIVPLAKTPNDPKFIDQWALQNINAAGAWDYHTGSSTVVVGVIDTGAFLDHEDIQPNLWVNPLDPVVDNIDDDDNEKPDDTHGWDFALNRRLVTDWALNSHGTRVASIAGAKGNNGAGVTGVMWNVKLAILGVAKPLSTGVDTGAVVQALNYAVEKGMKIVNTSFESPENFPSWQDAFLAAANAGLTIVSASGNQGRDIDSAGAVYPCAYDFPGLICVAAIDSNNNLWSGSDYGKISVDLAAPGVSILAALKDSDGALTYGTSNQQSGSDVAGTSWAAPHVTGVVGLMKSRNPSYTNKQLKEFLLLSAQPVTSGALDEKVHTDGKLDARLAITAFGDSFDDAPENSRFFSNSTTGARWAVAQNGNARCDTTVKTISGSRDRTSRLRYAGVAGNPGAFWSLASYKASYAPGNVAQSLVLRVISTDGSDLVGEKGKVGVGFVEKTGSSSQTCPESGLTYTKVNFNGSSLAGVELDGSGTAIAYVFFSVPSTSFFSETRYVSQAFSVFGVKKLSLQIQYGSSTMTLNVTDSSNGNILFSKTNIPYPTSWWPSSASFQPAFAYWGIDSFDPAEHQIDAKAFLSVR